MTYADAMPYLLFSCLTFNYHNTKHLNDLACSIILIFHQPHFKD